MMNNDWLSSMSKDNKNCIEQFAKTMILRRRLHSQVERDIKNFKIRFDLQGCHPAFDNKLSRRVRYDS